MCCLFSGCSGWMVTSHRGSDWQDGADHQRSHHRRQAAVPCASPQHGGTQCSRHPGSTRHYQRDNASVLFRTGPQQFPHTDPGPNETFSVLTWLLIFLFFLSSQSDLKSGSPEISARLSSGKWETLSTLWSHSRCSVHQAKSIRHLLEIIIKTPRRCTSDSIVKAFTHLGWDEQTIQICKITEYVA